MFHAFFLSLVVIFIAELGDKSQLMALTFATRFPIRVVLAGITTATAVVHAVSVGIGAAVGAALPTRPIKVVAAVAFVIFALWTLRGDRLTDEERERAREGSRSAFWVVTVVFFLAELGDKTMLATITLGATHEPIGTWLGSTAGMVLADALAVGAGSLLATRVAPRTIARFAAASFVIFGLLLAYEGVRGLLGA